ncbi:MAG: hypothetical protein M1840_003891 [Geoglossum simile]|nr:MAG: hypothetical protein M1840_003891 [Geoglossum simile]
MATLNLSTNGPSITRSYQSIVNAAAPSGLVSSQTYGQWAIFSVSAPLVNAFTQDSGGKESVLKVQSTGEGELVDLIDELSDGKIQFAFVKVKDTNTTLPKFVLIGWCGEGVPERTKGYFTSHLAAVSRILHGYHVQITARSEHGLNPESIIRKVADASGSKYSSTTIPGLRGPPPPVTSKPVFTPTRIGGGGGFNPLSGQRLKPAVTGATNADDDGWGEDAPPVTRTQLEKVQSAYKPTKVNMSELTSQGQEPPLLGSGVAGDNDGSSNIVKGTYQPVGKVDIAAIRRQAQQSGSSMDDRPTVVKGAYEPVGKVDIAAIRARVQPGRSDNASDSSPAKTDSSVRSSSTDTFNPIPKPSSAYPQPERLTSLVKPKVANRFGSSASTFAGTKAPLPGAFGLESAPAPAAPVGATSRTFADEGGKTPAQIWAERKARERGFSGAGDTPPTSSIGGLTSPIEGQKSGGEWKSGYSGKSWAPIQTDATGRSSGGSVIGRQRTGQDEPVHEEHSVSPSEGISALRDRFKGAAPMGVPSVPLQERSAPSPPPLNISSKPNSGGVHGGVSIPGFPSEPTYGRGEREQYRATAAPPHRGSPTPTPPRAPSPIRVALPVARNEETRIEPPVEQLASQVLPIDQSRPSTTLDQQQGEKCALVQFDYDKAEDNELELKEGEYVKDIDMVDEDWWWGRNPNGDTGLFPASYVELVEVSSGHHEPYEDKKQEEPITSAPAPKSDRTAIAIYDYEAAEDNELNFGEGAEITGVEFPDDDWWFGETGGKSGLFPANYVELQK